MLFVSQYEETEAHYAALYPPGWCLLKSLEERHSRHWQTVSQLFKLDKMGQVWWYGGVVVWWCGVGREVRIYLISYHIQSMGLSSPVMIVLCRIKQKAKS